MTTKDEPTIKSKPITKLEAGPFETEIQKFERYLCQLSRCIQACSLCELGEHECFYNNTNYDPHCPNPLNFNKIIFVKFTPNEIDISDGLFSDLKPTFDKIEIDFKSIYKTAINKCHGKIENKCPYFELEIKASRDLFKLIIIFDKKSADFFGIEYIPGKLEKHCTYKTYCCDDNNLKQILKLIKLSKTNSQIYNNLFV
jgi:hypothetical protein